MKEGHLNPPESANPGGNDPGSLSIFRLPPWQIASLLLLLAFCCDWPALRGGFLWDDQAHVTRPDLQSLAGLGHIWFDLHATQQYYPLLHSAFWFEHRLWGDAPLGYHLINVALHVLAATLLIVVLRRLKVPGAELAGVLFTVHPVVVESVAWISEQKNTLSLVFYLWSVLEYLRFDDDLQCSSNAKAAGGAYVRAFVLFVLALLTKSVTATLPAALLVILWWRRGRLSWRRDIARLLPWFAVATASGLFTAWVERRYNGAVGAAFDLTLGQRVLLAGRIVWFYLGKLAWPSPLIFFYPRWDVRSAAGGWAGYLAAFAIVTAILGWLSRRWRGPLAAWLFFVGSLFPALGFFDVYPFNYSYVADHFQYLASLGIITAAAAGAAELYARCAPGARVAGRIIGAGLIAVFIGLSHAQSRNYRNVTTLYTATIKQNPGCFMAHNNLGIELERTGHPAAAEAEYREAIAAKPDLAEAHYNLGHLWLLQPNRSEAAAAEFREALRLRPDYPEAHDNLGNALAQQSGQRAEAIAQYREALRQRPDYPEAHVNLGKVLDAQGRTAEAIAEFEAALKSWPKNVEVHLDLGTDELKSPERLADAISQFREAVRLRPDVAEIHLALAAALLHSPDNLEPGVAELEKALQLDPGLEPAQRLLRLVRTGGEE